MNVRILQELPTACAAEASLSHKNTECSLRVQAKIDGGVTVKGFPMESNHTGSPND